MPSTPSAFPILVKELQDTLADMEENASLLRWLLGEASSPDRIEDVIERYYADIKINTQQLAYLKKRIVQSKKPQKT
jgi:hypothetical protein